MLGRSQIDERTEAYAESPRPHESVSIESPPDGEVAVVLIESPDVV